MLINLSNHPSEKWSTAQKNAAAIFGNIFDMPFPFVNPGWSTGEIIRLSVRYEDEIIRLLECKASEHNAVHLMGELTLCFDLLKRLQKRGITCIASTSERIVQEKGNTKTAEFVFCRFREYTS